MQPTPPLPPPLRVSTQPSIRFRRLPFVHICKCVLIVQPVLDHDPLPLIAAACAMETGASRLQGMRGRLQQRGEMQLRHRAVRLPGRLDGSGLQDSSEAAMHTYAEVRGCAVGGLSCRTVLFQCSAAKPYLHCDLLVLHAPPPGVATRMQKGRRGRERDGAVFTHRTRWPRPGLDQRALPAVLFQMRRWGSAGGVAFGVGGGCQWMMGL